MKDINPNGGLHPRKLTYPLKNDYFSREYIFQPLIFRGHVSFQGSNGDLPWYEVNNHLRPIQGKLVPFEKFNP